MAFQRKARIACLAIICAVFATGASAQVTGKVVSQTVYASGPSFPSPFNQLVSDSSVQFGYNHADGEYQNYQTSTHIDNVLGRIDFANNSSATGAGSLLTTSSNIRVDYTNNTDQTINPTLTSTITPAGFGMYMANAAGNPTYPGMLHALVADINQHPEVTNCGFPCGNDVYGIPSDGFSSILTLGQVSVSFQILSGVTTLADYNATLALTGFYAPNDHSIFTVLPPSLTVSSSTGLTLRNFGLIAADDPNRAVGYRWDATPIVLSLGDLAAHASSSLTYITTVSVAVGVHGYGETTPQLMAYAGFGDPIGADGGAGGIADPEFPLIKLGLPTFDPATGDFQAFGFRGYEPPLPLINVDANGPVRDDTGAILMTIPPFPARLANASAAVPEPGVWALLLTGFGGIGASLRRARRRAGPSAA